jgi:hypothetical protein
VAAANTDGGDVVIDFAVPGPFDVGANGGLSVDGDETLTIKGRADGSTVIDGGGTARVIAVALPDVMSSCGATSTSLTLDGVTVRNGHSTGSPPDDGFGGGVDVNCDNKLSVVDSTFAGNQAERGGGAINDNTTSTVTVLRSTFAGNSAVGTELSDGGGAIEVSTAANLLVVDSTLSGNDTAFTGGAVYAVTGAAITLVNDTVAGNAAPSGMVGGVVAAVDGSTTASNTIVAGNGTNCLGTVTDGGHNLEDGTSCGFSANAINGNPKLEPLQANGGPTETMALQPDSPAINAGADSICAAPPTATPPGAGAHDQRSATRPQGAHCDIGAFEVVATTTTLDAPATAAPDSSYKLTATVTPAQAIPGRPAGTVTFLDGTTVLGVADLSGTAPDTATLTLTAALGTHLLSARFDQTPLFLSSVSAPLTQTVEPAAAVAGNSGSAAPGLISSPNTGAAPAAGGAGLLGGGVLAGSALLLRRRRRGQG